MFGIAVEEVNLHRRIALRILLFVGEEPRWLLAGIMITTAFLSMWISNTATTSMMVPVVISLATELIRTDRSQRRMNAYTVAPVPDQLPMTIIGADSNPDNEPEPSRNQRSPDEVVVSRKTLSKQELNMCKAMMLAVCYSATLGGTATLTGTPPNVIMTGLLTKRYGSEHPINYASWMGYNCPGMIINIIFAWSWLQIFFLGPKNFIQCFKKKPPNRLLKGTVCDVLMGNRVALSLLSKRRLRIFLVCSPTIRFG